MGARACGLWGTLVVLLVAPVAAGAHDEAVNDGALHHNRHAVHDHHESEQEGHIEPDVNYGLRPVGHDTLGGISDDRYTDVWADDRGYAYVGTFHEPTCDRSGVFISDIRDPQNPTTVTMIESPPDTRVNDVKTIQIGDRTVLIHTLEPCAVVPGTGFVRGQGGVSLWDVTVPERPHALKQNFLDFPVHNTFPWHDTTTGRTYLIGVNNVGVRDVWFADITRPQSPKLLAEVGLPDWSGAQDSQSDGIGGFAASFNHDVWIANVGTEQDPDYQAAVSYWDAGFVTLDVNDPTAPTFVDDSTYPNPDPITGFSPPEGNAHAAAYNNDASRILAGDEDFGPFRTLFEITGGPNAGEYEASEGAFTEPIATLEDQAMNGPTTYLGLGCDPSADLTDPPTTDATTDAIAVFQRGDCRFDTKAQTAINNGYEGFIVFNDAARGDDVITMGGEPRDLPGIFVGHSTGLAIFDAETAGDLAIGQIGAAVAAEAVFDGWGYFHLLDRATLKEIGYYAPGQVNDRDYAFGFGDLTMHNVEGARRHTDIAWFSWYSLGMRAVQIDTGNSVRPPDDDWDAATPPVNDYYADNATEVGRFIAEDGSNFWGVHETAFDVDGTPRHFILGSDRNTGLWIFEYDPSYCEATEGFDCPS